MFGTVESGVRAEFSAWVRLSVAPLLPGLFFLLAGCGSKQGAPDPTAKQPALDPAATYALTEDAARFIEGNQLKELQQLLKKHPEVLDYSPGPDGRPTRQGVNLLDYAISMDRPAALKVMLDLKPDLSVVPKLRGSRLDAQLLCHALGKDKSRMAGMLLDHGLDVRGIDANGSVFAWVKSASLMQRLIKEGADVNRPNEHNGPPLVYKARHRSWELATVLLEAGADPNGGDDRGRRAIHSAAAGGRGAETLAFLRLLIAKGADVNAQTNGGDTPLHLCRTVEAMKILLDAGAHPNIKGERGNTPLHLARKRRDPATAELLLARGADATLKNGLGRAAGDVVAPPPPRKPRLSRDEMLEEIRQAREAKRARK